MTSNWIALHWLKRRLTGQKTRTVRTTTRFAKLDLEALEPRLAPAALSATTWVAIGPAPITNGQIPGAGVVSGRVTGIAPDITDPNTIFIATAGGGVWKTSNGGSSWTPLTDSVIDSSGKPVVEFMGAIAETRDSSNNEIVYAGTGEANNSADTFYGEGILVSVNGGSTWTLTGQALLKGTAISRIAVDPNNSNIAYAAVSNTAVNGTTAAVTGIYKTTNAGGTWTNVTALNGQDNIDPWSDVVIDPLNSAILFAAVGNPNGSGGNGVFTGNGVYTSTDAGAHWSLVGGGMPSGATLGRIALAIAHPASPAQSATVYASIATPGGTLLNLEQSTDGGTTWSDKQPFNDSYLTSQGNYDNVVAIDRTATDVFAAGVLVNQGNQFGFSKGGIEESQNGGTNWQEINNGTSTNPGNGPHTDYHAMAFDASGRLIVGNDGGVWRLDSNVFSPANIAWTDLNSNLAITQFYGIALDPTTTLTAYGGSQDNGTEKYSGNPTWSQVVGGDGGITRVSPASNTTVYEELSIAAAPTFNFQRSTNGGTNFTSITAGIVTNPGGTPIANFLPPYVLDSSGDVYYGTDYLNFSSNQGATWSQIGTPGTKNFNPSNVAIDDIAVAPSNNNVVYVSAGGRIFVTQNAQAGGANVSWTEIDFPGFPGASAASSFLAFADSIAINPTQPGIAFAVVNSFTGGKKHVFKTTTFGSAANGAPGWTDISGNLPDTPVNAIALSPDGSTIFVGTDIGVYASTDGGTTWNRFGLGLPNAQVRDLEVQQIGNETILAAGTFGRGMFEILLSVNGVGAFADQNQFSDLGPALGSVNILGPGQPSSLILAWRGRGNHFVNIMPLNQDGSPDTADQFVSGYTTNGSPSLATLNNQLFVAFTDDASSHNIFVAPVTFNGTTPVLGSAIRLGFAPGGPYESTDSSPVLTNFNGNLYVAWTGQSNDLLNVMELNANGSANENAKFTSGATVNGTPALGVFGNQLFVALTGQAHNELDVSTVTINSSGAPVGIPNFVTLQPNENSNDGPALGSSNDQLVIGWTGQGAGNLNLMGLNTLNGISSFEPHPVSTFTSSSVPALALNNGQLYTAWTGTDSSGTMYVAPVGLPAPPVSVTASGLVEVNGGLTSDTISVGTSAGGGVEIVFNGTTTDFAPGSISGVVISTSPQVNTVNVLSAIPGVPVTIHPGSGTTTVNVTPNSQGPAPALTINGGIGIVNVVVNDQADSGNRTYAVTSSSLTITDTGTGATLDTINLGAGLQSLTINAGSGVNTLNVQSTPAATTTINTGSGSDVVNAGSRAPQTGGVLSGMAGTLSVNGGTGTAVFNVDDSGDPNPATLNVTSTTLTGATLPGGIINYSTLIAVNVDLPSGGGNTLNVLSASSTTPVDVIGNVNLASLNLAGGSLTVTGAVAITTRTNVATGTLNVVGSVTANAPIMLSTGGTLNISGTLTSTASFFLLGGTLGNATVQAPTVITANDFGGTLNAITLNGILDLVTNNEATATVTGGIVVNSTIQIGNASGSFFDSLAFSGTETISTTSAASLVLGVSSFNSVVVTPGSTLTVATGVTIDGQAGVIGTGTPAYIQTTTGGSIINNGAIAADEAGGTSPGTINIVAATFVNNASIQVSNGETLNLGNSNTTWSNPTGTIGISSGILNLGGTFMQRGTFNRTGGIVNLVGTLNNNNNPGLVLDSTTGPWNLVGGTINTGLITTNGSNVLVGTANGGTLNGVTYDGVLNLVANNVANVTATNGLVLNGVIDIGAPDSSTVGSVTFSSTQSLSTTSTASVVLGGSTFDSLAVTAGTTLTVAAGVTIDGQSGTIGTGRPAYIQTTIGGNILNNGVIAADGAGRPTGASPGTFIIVAASFTNNASLQVSNNETLNVGTTGTTWSNAAGTITVASGILDLGGTFGASDVGTFSRNGGTVNLVGTLNNNSNPGLVLDATRGAWNLAGGTINGGIVTTNGSNDLVGTNTGGGGTLNGVTFNGLLDLMTNNVANVTVTNGLVLNGVIDVGAPNSSFADSVTFSGTQSLSTTSTASIVLGISTLNSVAVTPGSTLTVAAGVTIDGQAGTIGTGTPAYFQTTIGGNIVNNSVIAADGAGRPIGASPGAITIVAANFANNASLQVSNNETVNLGTTGTTWSNTAGTITVAGGVLNLGGTFGTSDVGTFNRSGGTVNLVGTLNNSSNPGLVLDATRGAWNLARGTINGGAVTTNGGNDLVGTDAGGTLNGVILNGVLDLVTNNVANVTVTAGLVLNGVINIGANSGAAADGLTFSGTQSLTTTSTGKIVLGLSTFNSVVIPTGTTLTVAAGITIDGQSGVIGTGTPAYFQTTTGGSIVNNGAIAADGAGGGSGSVSIVASSFTNNASLQVSNGETLNLGGSGIAWTNPAGVISDSGGILNLGGTFMPSDVGTFQRTGGTVNLVGTLNNSSGPGLMLNSTSGPWNLTGGTINGGIVTTSGNNDLVGTSTGGTLNGVTFNGLLDLMTNNVANVTVTGGLVLNGVINVGGANPSFADSLTFSGTQSVTTTSTGNMVLGSSTLNSVVIPAGTTLTVAAGITIDGQSGIIGTGTPAYFQTTTGGSITNNGTIAADGGGAITVMGDTNYGGGTLTGGTWKASGGGTLRLLGANISTNAATIVVDGAASHVYSDNATTNALAAFTTNAGAGSFTIQNGFNLNTGTAFTNSGLVTIGTGSTLTVSTYQNQGGGNTILQGGALSATTSPGVTIQGGTLSGSGTVNAAVSNAGVVSPGATTPGRITINGAYTQTSAGSLNVKIAGRTTAGVDYDQLAISGTATLGGAINVTVMNGFMPQPGDQYQIMTFASSSGDFATKNGFNLGGGKALSEQFSPSNLALTVSQTAALSGLPVVNGSSAVINIVSATGNGSTATITTDGTPHGFWVGELVTLTGTTPGGPGGLAGAFTVTGVPSATTFQFTSTYSGSETLSGTTVTAALAGVQRSMVDSILYNFTEAVNLTAAAFTINVVVNNTTTGSMVGVAPTLNVAAVPFTNEWVVTFTDPVNSVIGKSIANGAYTIAINQALVTAVSGGQDLSSGETDTFYRLYGDVTGVQSVKNVDANAFNRAWGHAYYSAGYNAALDYNDDGKYTNIDANAFNRAFNTRYSVATTI